MPYIEAKLTAPVTPAQQEALKAGFGRAVTALHKTETYLMVGIEGGKDLWFGGRKLEQGAYLSVSLFGRAAPADCEEMTGRLCTLLDEVLGIPGENVYITYHPIENWGWNGSNF